MPRVAVFDADRNPSPPWCWPTATAPTRSRSPTPGPGADYFVRVSADPTSGKVVGNYDLDVEYGHEAAAPATFVASTLGGSDPPRSYDLVVNQPQLFDFLLAAGADVAPPGSGVRMTIIDGAGPRRRRADRGRRGDRGGRPRAPGAGGLSGLLLRRRPGGGPPHPWPSASTARASPTRSGLRWTTPRSSRSRPPSPGDPAAAAFPAIGSPGRPVHLAGRLGVRPERSDRPHRKSRRRGRGRTGRKLVSPERSRSPERPERRGPDATKPRPRQRGRNSLPPGARPSPSRPWDALPSRPFHGAWPSAS